MNKAAETRSMILSKSFELIYKKGYQSTSIDDIIATTQVTKGAFYYHFKSKEEMGLGLINDLLYPGFHNMMIKPLENSKDPVADIYTIMEMLLNDAKFFNVAYGCPAVNLIEEMAPINQAFQKALLRLVNLWRNAIAAALKSAIIAGRVDPKVSPEETAVVIISGYVGVRNLGKVLGVQAYKTYLNGLKDYLSKL